VCSSCSAPKTNLVDGRVFSAVGAGLEAPGSTYEALWLPFRLGYHHVMLSTPTPSSTGNRPLTGPGPTLHILPSLPFTSSHSRRNSPRTKPCPYRNNIYRYFDGGGGEQSACNRKLADRSVPVAHALFERAATRRSCALSERSSDFLLSQLRSSTGRRRVGRDERKERANEGARQTMGSEL